MLKYLIASQLMLAKPEEWLRIDKAVSIESMMFLIKGLLKTMISANHISRKGDRMYNSSPNEKEYDFRLSLRNK